MKACSVHEEYVEALSSSSILSKRHDQAYRRAVWVKDILLAHKN